MAYTRRKTTFKKPRGRYSKKRTTTTRGRMTHRRMPYRRRKFTRRVATPNSVIHGVTSIRLDKTDLVKPALGRLNGTEISGQGDANFFTKVALSIKPNEIVDLVARENLYKQYRVDDVEWMFKRTDHALQATGGISANYRYADSAAVMPNTANEEIPDSDGAYNVSEMIKWMTQNKGKRLPLNARKVTLRVPPRVVINRSYKNVGQGNNNTETTTTMRMPWMDLDQDKMTMSLGQCVVVLPTLDVRTFFQVYIDDTTQNGQPGSTNDEITDTFRYEVYARVKWSCKGKYVAPAEASVFADEEVESGFTDMKISEF